MVAHDHPLAAGEKVASLSAGASLMKTPLFLPSGEGISASDAQTWVRTGQDEYLLIVFESGLQVEIRPWPSSEGTPEDHWSLLQKDGIPGNLERIGGFNMFIVAPSERSSGSADFVKEGSWVSIYGEGLYSADELRALAQNAASSEEAI
jgi:hypothetical protein